MPVAQRVDVVVLLGAPGSGKSTVGAELGRLGLRWRDWERWILDQWGGMDAWLADKAANLAQLHVEIQAFIRADGPPAVIESTGLSDGPFLEELTVEFDTFIVRLDVAEAEAARRVAKRAHGNHLTDDGAANRRVWRAFYESVAPNSKVDLVVDTASTGPAAIATHILELITLGAAGESGAGT